MHMYHNTKGDMPEYFRAELSQFMSGMRMKHVQEIQKIYEQYEVGKSPSTGKCVI